MKKKQPKKEELVAEISHFKNRIAELVSRGNQLQNERDQLSKEKEVLISEKERLDNNNNLKTEKIKELGEYNTNLKKQIDENEVKLLASAFANAEEVYNIVSKKWENYLFLSIAITFILYSLGIYILISSSEIDPISRISFYAVAGILIFYITFCAKQHSFYRNLLTDMRHRRVLAQSYYNIIRSVEDVEIKPKLAEKVIDYITTPPHSKEDEMNTPLDLVKGSVSSEK